ncbi:MAG: spinster family MFS transporter, partial [Pseudomonadales bacterium]
MRIELRQHLAGKSWYKWYALGVLTFVYASNQLDRQIMAILLEPIKLELNASDTQMGFLVGLTFALFYATLGMPIAMLADRKNRRNIITAAVTIWSAFTVLCGYANSFAQLALARTGVAIGEAGSTPPSHSLISDLFPAKSRATAMGIFAVGVNIGLLMAYLGGGWLSEHYGWRVAFVAVGVPGLLIALIVYFTTIEPRRGASDLASVPVDTGAAPKFWAVAGHMWNTRTTRHVIIGASLAAFIGYGFVLWLPSFFMRSHGLAPTEIGLILALMTGIVGGLGTFTAGRLTDVLAARDVRWRCWFVAASTAFYVPFLVAFFMAETLWVAI